MFLLSVVLSLVLSGVSFRWARNFMSRRLRYVDAAHSRFAPLIAGVAVGLLVLPVTWLPIVGAVAGAGTAVAIGVGVGLGVASASRQIRLAGYHVER